MKIPKTLGEVKNKWGYKFDRRSDMKLVKFLKQKGYGSLANLIKKLIIY